MIEQFEDSDEFAMDEQEHAGTPFSAKDIKVNTQTIALSTLIARLKSDGIDLRPSLQPNDGLCTDMQISRLIESILLKMPLQSFYFDGANPDKWLVVDGLQRLSAIKRFIVDEHPPLKLTQLEFLTNLNGKTYQELSRPLQRVIDETQVVTYQIEPQTPKEVRYSIFNRINTGGSKLNGQEIRQTLNQQGVAIAFLKRQCELSMFRQLIEMSADRMLDRELVLRFFAFRLLEVDETFKNLPWFLDRAMEKIDQQTVITDQLEQLSAEFDQALFLSARLLRPDHHPFSKNQRYVNRALFDVMTVCVSQVEDKAHLMRHSEQFKDRLLAMLADEQSTFSKAILQQTSSKRAVIDRFNEMRQLISDIENMA
jgi:hypothetical protein